MDQIFEQLKNMNISCGAITPIREKDGVLLYRIKSGGSSYVLKYFEQEAYRREIENYRILNRLGIPTLSVIAQTDCALLLEDVEQSQKYRLGTAADLSNEKTARKIAGWYRLLHEKGRAFVADFSRRLYDETDLISEDNFELIKTKTGTADAPVWALLSKNFDEIAGQIRKLDRTLTYNDFYYTNLIVAKDGSAAYMFDYNLLGKGYVYSDIRNVCSSLGPEAKAAFLSGYGCYDQSEVLVDDVASVLVTLYFACKRDVFPTWAEPYRNQVNDGFFEKVKMLLERRK